MNLTIHPGGSLHGVLRPPSDRSLTIRAALLASLAQGESVIRAPLHSDDAEAALGCLARLGAPIEQNEEGLRILGRGQHGLRAPTQPLFCNASGTTMRLMAGLMAGQQFDSTLDGNDQLRRRPMRRVTEPLRAMGAQIDDTDGCAPLRVRAAHAPLRGIDYTLPVASAQVKSAMLLAGLYAEAPVVVHEPAPTRDHTERLLRALGATVITEPQGEGARIALAPAERPLSAFELTVPADFSSAAFFIVAAVLVPGSVVRLTEVGLNPTRTGLLDILKAMGAQITVEDQRDVCGEPVGTLEVRAGALRAVEVGGALIPRAIDELPILAVAATQAHGVTVVRNAEELRVKESNRLEGFLAELRKLGARAEPTADGFVVEGPTLLRGATVDGLGDHRVAMSLAVAALVADSPTTILGADCVAKTYPRFFEDLAALRAVP